ncbi:MAG: peroxide stress protein YaaA [Pseudomonadota bacterium]
MLIVISPAKTLDYATKINTAKATQPQFLDEAAELNQVLRNYSAQKIANLMDVSKGIAELNFARNQQWSVPFTSDNSRQAIFAFKGDVYMGLNAHDFAEDDLAFAQQHLRILSGLYGALRPLDLMQPYRLEMSTRLKNPHGKNLYKFWDGKVTATMNNLLAAQKNKILINLASEEYFAVLQPKSLDAEVVTPVFKDYKNGKYKIISFFAKKARGRMAAWIIKNRITEKAGLSSFAEDGYSFSPESSQEDELVFTRKIAD